MAEMVIDPVCKMEVDPDTAAARSDYNGATYYFCAAGCKLAFDEDPSKYLNGAPAPASGAAEAAAAATPAAGASKPPWWQFWRT